MNGEMVSSDIVSLRVLYNAEVVNIYHVTAEKGCGHFAKSNGRSPTSGLLSKDKAMTKGRHHQHKPLQYDDLS